MATFVYNDLTFTVEPAGPAWDIQRQGPGGPALLGAGLFPGADAAEAEARARTLVRTVHPVGVRCVGPDVAHPNTIGDLRIVGPDVAHPNFIHWTKDSASDAQRP